MTSEESVGASAPRLLHVDEAAKCARFIHDQIPADGLFAGHKWRISTAPFPLGEELAKEIESLGRVLPQF